MSAAAHTNINQTEIASVQLNSEPAVTSISVSARIDYIQRFSKQAVLIIDDDVTVYTQAARQFLINLSKDKSSQETNVAFVSASTKLNDIQMRCRLIEQLFSNTLFDPEKSLAVSILNLSKQSKENITIVVEHAHALSLQMKYELCQLVDIANKTQGKINVALFGQEQAAQNVAANKSIFKNKLAIVDAKSGQLFSLEHAKFKSENRLFTNKFWLKTTAVVFAICAIVSLSWFLLINYDNFSLSKLPVTKAPENKLILADAKPINSKMPTVTDVDAVIKLAETADIHAALLGKKAQINEVNNTPAQAVDILQALDVGEPQNTTIVTKTNEVSIEKVTFAENILPKPIVIDKPVQQASIENISVANPKLALTPDYYINKPAGYVVQLVGFSDHALLERFIKNYPDIEYFSYQKKLNNKMFFVLTTKIFENKEQARIAMQFLPQDIIDRGIWIKELSMVQDEINKL